MACYSLVNCDGITTAFIDYAPGGLTLGNVITTNPPLAGPSNCWQVSESITCTGTEIVVTSIYDFGANPGGCITCEDIVPIRLKNCDETGGIVYIQINYTTTIPVGNVIAITPVPADYLSLPNCWEVMPSGTLLPTNYNVASITDQGTCLACLNPPSCYNIVNCLDEEISYQVSTPTYPGLNVVISITSMFPLPPGVVNCWKVKSETPCEPAIPTITYNVETSCEDCTAPPPLECYVLRSCSSTSTGVYYTNNPAFAPYAGGGLTTQIAEYTPGVCYTVELVTGPCNCIAPESLNPVGPPNCSCTSIYSCYTLTKCDNPSFIIYTQSNLNPYVGLTVSVAEYPGFCFNVAGIANPFVCDAAFQQPVTCIEPCVCGVVTYCFTLTNCEVDPTSGLPITQVVSTSTILTPTHTIIPVPAIIYPGVGNCWTVTDTYSPCNSSTGITLTGFTDLGPNNCELCLGPPQCYKLTSCDQATVVYTTSDLSAFVNNFAQIPLLPGTCWFVETVADCLSPLLTITGASFCLTPCPVYTLTPCGGGTVEYTFTNLAIYVGTAVIHFDELGGCEGPCYTVSIGGIYADAISVTVSSCPTPCPPCNQTCYALEDCTTKEIYEVLSNPTANGVDLSLYVNQVLGQLCLGPDSTDCTLGCWTIKETDNCTGAISAYVQTTNIYSTCTTCRNSCYGLQDCNTGEVILTIKYTIPNPLGFPNPGTLVGSTLGDLCFTLDSGGCIAGCLQVVLLPVTDCDTAIDWSEVVGYTQYPNCYDCTPKCYLLTDCTGVQAPFVVNNNFSAYVDSYIKICEADVCKCYFVELSTSCAGAITVGNPSATFVTCEACRSCGCPPGYTQNGDICEKIVTIPATIGETVYTVQPGSRNIDYGTLGTNFYTPNLSTLSYPIIENGTGNFQDASTFSLTDVNNTTSVWGPGFSTSRLNSVGVWAGAAPNPLNEWIGFTHCLDLTDTGTYCIGIAGDNKVRLKIDGVLVLEATNNTDFNFKYWHVFEVTLTQGLHVIELSGLNLGGAAAFGAEIYNVSLATLQSYATSANPYLDVQLATVFSTFDKIGDNFDVGEASGYTCPDGYTFSNCTADGPSCTLIQSVPFVLCLPTYKVTDCTGAQAPFVTNTDLSQYVGGYYKTCIENPEYSTLCYILRDCNRVNPDIYTTTDLSTYLWQSVELDGYPGSCFIVTGVPVGGQCRDTEDVTVTKACTCPDAQTPWPDGCYCVYVEEVDYSTGADFIGEFGQGYLCCEDCTRVCYILRPCAGDITPVTVCNDLSAYMDPPRVIKITGCGDICWTIEESRYACNNALFIEGEIVDYLTCDACLPPTPPTPPLVLHPRKVKPGYDSPNSNISVDYIQKVNCTFAEQVYNQMLVNRYGITVCCNEDLTKWDIKKQVLDYELLIDPSLCKSTICYCPDPCFLSAIITVLPTCIAPYLIRATLDPLCYPPVVTSVEITVESSLPCYCYTTEILEVGPTPIIVGYIDCCCKDVITIYEEATTVNMCALYPPVTSEPLSTNVTSSGLCSDLCVVPPPVCICWQIINDGFVTGVNPTITYTPCGSETPIVLTIAAEVLTVCSYNMPVGITTDEPITVNNLGPCALVCSNTCKCFFIEFDEPTANFQIFNCETQILETVTLTSGYYACSGTVPVVLSTVTNFSMTLVDPAQFTCTTSLRCAAVVATCYCWSIALGDGQGAQGICGGIVNTKSVVKAGTVYLCSETLPTPLGAYIITPVIVSDCADIGSICNNP